MRIGSDDGAAASVAKDERGQTLQDFVLGVSLLLVVVIFVFSLLPGYLSPYTAGIGGDERAQADRVARTAVSNLSVAPGNDTLDAGRLDVLLSSDQETIRDRFGLPPTSQVSITIRTIPNGSVVSVGGDPLTNDRNRTYGSAARASRLAYLSETDCQPACRLVVEVW